MSRLDVVTPNSQGKNASALSKTSQSQGAVCTCRSQPYEGGVPDCELSNHCSDIPEGKHAQLFVVLSHWSQVQDTVLRVFPGERDFQERGLHGSE